MAPASRAAPPGTNEHLGNMGPVIAAEMSAKPPWSPWFIGIATIVLSLIGGPIALLWSAVMIPLNWRRLGCFEKTWRPVKILVPAIGIMYLVNCFGAYSGGASLTFALVSTLATLAIAILVVYVEVRCQLWVYREHRLHSGVRANALWPSIAMAVVLALVWSCEFYSASGQAKDDAAERACANGEEMMKKGDYDKAIANYNEAIRLDPKLARAFNNRGFAYYGKREYDKAIADCSEAIRLDPKIAWAAQQPGFGLRE